MEYDVPFTSEHLSIPMNAYCLMNQAGLLFRSTFRIEFWLEITTNIDSRSGIRIQAKDQLNSCHA